MIETASARAGIGQRQPSPPPIPTLAGGLDTPELPKSPAHFLARQPILDLKQKLHGYAMLRRTRQITDEVFDPQQTACRDLYDYLPFMPEALGERGFVRCSREILTSPLAELLPPQHSVLQIPVDVATDAEVVAYCGGLKKKGYRFALETTAPAGARHPLLDLADYLMVDFQALDKEARREVYRMAQGSKAKVVAGKVEKTEELEMARREGAQYFQGFFINSSAVAARRTIPTNQVICLRLMTALADDSTEVKQIESMVMMDTSLTYQLLRRVNSVTYSLNTRVTSIKSALVFVGNDEFRKLVSAALANVFASSQSKTLITIALERAKFCEILAPRLREHGPKLYLLGMLSLIDIILQVPMAQVMESVPIDADMKAALKGEQSQIGTVLELVRGYQAANWEKCDLLQQKLGLSESDTAGTYMESVHWTSRVLHEEV